MPLRRTLVAAAFLLTAPALTPVPARAQLPGECADGETRTKLRWAVGTTAVGANVGMWLYFKNAWWSGQPARHWFIRDDWDLSFRDQDKFGHMFGGYHLTRGGAEALRLACVPEKKAIAYAAAYAALFQLQIEIWDGTQAQYGFSPGDVLANSTGAALAVTQFHSKWLQAVKPTISWSPTLSYRTRFQHGNEPRATVDYSGQTYWFSTDLHAVLPEGARRFWPAFARVSVGHSITDWVDWRTGASIRAKRKILVSIDFDPSKLPGNNPVWRAVKHELSYYHFPAPALQFTPTFKGISWYR